MKILFIGHGLNFGGASESLYILILGLLKLGHTIKVVVPTVEDINAKYRLEKVGVTVDLIDCGQFHSNQGGHTPLYRLPNEVIKYYKNKKKIINYIELNKFDVIHLNSSVLAHLLKLIKKSKPTLICFIHIRELLSNNYDRYFIGSTLLKLIHKWADNIICISENEAERLILNDKISVIYNPFNFDQHSENKLSLPDLSQKIKIMMMGQFHAGKGQLDFLRAVRIFIDKSPSLAGRCHFVILGFKESKIGLFGKLKEIFKENYNNKFFKTLDELKLKNIVDIIPYKKDISYDLNNTSVVVRTSISGDPWGRDIIESMSYGKAIIATGTYSGFVKPGVNGELVAPCKPIEIAEALMNIVPVKIKIYGENSLKIAKLLFNADTHAEKINNLYLKEVNEDCI